MFGNKFPPLPFLTRKMLNFEEGNGIQIEIRSQSRSGGSVTIRGMTREGLFIFVHQMATAGALTVETFGIPDIPIMLTVVDRTGSKDQGNTYIVINLLIDGEVIQELTAGLVQRDKGITYPNAPTPNQRPNGGDISSFAIGNPAAGAEFAFVSPTNQAYRLMWVRFRLITDATVANRRVHLVLGDSAGISFDAIAGAVQTASQNIFYTAAAFPSMPIASDDNDILIPIPGNLIFTGESEINTKTTNLQAGDNFGTGDAVVEVFLQRL